MTVIPVYYQDQGCDVSPSCLDCPLSECKYDDPATYHREMRESRDRQVIEASLVQGKGTSQIARELGLSSRTISRVLAEHNKESY